MRLAWKIRRRQNTSSRSLRSYKSGVQNFRWHLWQQFGAHHSVWVSLRNNEPLTHTCTRNLARSKKGVWSLTSPLDSLFVHLRLLMFACNFLGREIEMKERKKETSLLERRKGVSPLCSHRREECVDICCKCKSWWWFTSFVVRCVAGALSGILAIREALMFYSGRWLWPLMLMKSN